MDTFNREGYVTTLLTTFFALDLAEKKRKELQATAELQAQVEIALELAQSPTTNQKLPEKPIEGEWLKHLSAMGVSLVEALTVKELYHIQGLSQPASPRQVDILKHFKMPGAVKMNKTVANYTIRRLFAEAENVEAWQQRPPTSRVMQGLLYINGSFTRGMTQYQAQRRLRKSGIESPSKYREWKRIEALFIGVNDLVTRQRNATRKITWKRFYHYYDELKSNGVASDEISVEMMLTRIAYHQRGELRSTHFGGDESALLAAV
ncbi:MAG: hypothetical protein JAZ20_18145 [Candidatus Thiodiazotropha weberae]|nr:hypothetical protein [Candidatus Thiodiazotropha lotti]MCG8012898.1 hypothetical protein [Candidatus Thiodiazotropha lotti]MCG8022320.1 hypothetical protein [Candidatus Thiodiazotropha lotti]MCW4209495.1 hypothetical protein [Candidatus Thiodiazotropha lotti]MCW4212369.1 hypothetical protein [Candidatus Thiodiazotropha lotti]